MPETSYSQRHGQTILEKFKQERGIKKFTNRGGDVGQNFVNSLTHDEAEEVLDIWYDNNQDEFNGVHSRFDRKHAGNVKSKDMLKALAKADYQDLKRYAFLAGLDNKWMKSMRGK